MLNLAPMFSHVLLHNILNAHPPLLSCCLATVPSLVLPALVHIVPSQANAGTPRWGPERMERW